MPYGDLTPYRDSNVMPRVASWPETPARQGLRVGIVSLALATLLSFAAGVGSTLVYFQSISEVQVAVLPLVEADKTPSRVRPEGLDSNGSRVVTATPANPSSLPSPISSALAAASADPSGLDLAPQGIPVAPEIVPPATAAIIELAPVARAVPAPAPAAPVSVAVEPPAPATVVAEPVPATAPATDQFRLQLASMRTPGGARLEMSRLNDLYATLAPDLELSVQRLDQGERGVFYRVLSAPVGERDDAAQLCAAIAERRGQCRVLAVTTPATRPVATAVAAAPAPAPTAPVAAATPPSPASPAAPVMAAKTAAMDSMAATGNNGVRAQLASLRSPEGAARELARLKELHAQDLTSTELTISKIDQGDRGVFYRILTAPLPDRDAASAFCQRLGPQHGCVLIGSRPSA